MIDLAGGIAGYAVAQSTMSLVAGGSLGLIVVIGAVITPSGDPLTLLLLSAPLYVLYEITILAIRLLLKK